MRKGIALIISIIAVMAFGCTPAAQNNTANNTSNQRATNTNMNGNMNASSPSPTGAPAADRDFFKEAAYGGMAEVEFSREILKTTKDAEIKKFAERMITDHGKANTELKALAAKKNVELPTGLDDDHQEDLDALRAAQPADRDAAYVDAMVDDHEAAVDLFEDQSEDMADKDLQDFATKTLPVLREHLQAIQAIDNRK